jgi:FMN phosphatase YigB (HAD superfamily)
MHESLPIIAAHETPRIVEAKGVTYEDALRRHMHGRIAQILDNLPDGSTEPLVILDMDGTLYGLDGENGGFQNSTKERHLTNAFTAYIQQQEPNLNPDEARQVFAQSLHHPIGPSLFLAERYDIHREDTFDPIWSMLDAEVIVGNPPHVVPDVLFEIRHRSCGIMLLTAAPQVWQQKVFKQLGLSPYDFDDVMTTEEFPSKKAVFETMRDLSPAMKAISVGDSGSSDIEPARTVGFQAIHIRNGTTFANVPGILDELNA